MTTKELPPDLPDDDAWRGEISEEPSGRRPLRVVTERETRPDIPIVPDVHLVTDAMIKVLVEDPEVYVRSGALVHVIRADDADGRAVVGTPVIREMPVSYAVDRISSLSRCVRRVRDKKGSHRAVHIPPPAKQVAAALERGRWPGARDLRGLLEAPAMRPDGSIIQAKGHDRVTGYLYEPNARFTPVDEAPTHSDAVRAYSRLAQPFAEFPYVSGAHRSATIAAVLTLLSRPAVQGAVPCWVFDASSRRSGKSLQVDVVHIIATGRSASRMTFPEVDEELEKVLSAYAIRGAASVNFDNVARKFGGAALEVITAVDEVDLRVLGSSEMRTVGWRAVLFASGNNVTFGGDMVARVLAPRLESKLDNPEMFVPTVTDLRAWTTTHRVELVHAALTLLRAFVVAGRPGEPVRWGGFDSWAALVPAALRWVGADDPMGARRGLEGDVDPDELAHAGLVDGWARLCLSMGKPDGLTVKQALAELYPGHRDEGPPDGYDDLREVIESVTNARPGFPPAGKHLGERMRKWRDKRTSGRALTGLRAGAGTIRWRVD